MRLRQGTGDRGQGTMVRGQYGQYGKDGKNGKDRWERKTSPYPVQLTLL